MHREKLMAVWGFSRGPHLIFAPGPSDGLIQPFLFCNHHFHIWITLMVSREPLKLAAVFDKSRKYKVKRPLPHF